MRMFTLLTILILYLPAAIAGPTPDLKKSMHVINESIDLTRQKIKENRDLNTLPDLYMTLADFQAQRASISLTIKHEQNPKLPLDQLDTTVEKRMKEEAIETYNLIISRFPTYRELDKALNFLGNEYLTFGQLEKSVDAFHQLTEQFPQSNLWDASQFAVGNHYFEKKDFPFAIQQFSKILARPEGPYTHLAEFRIGWCEINQSKWQSAFEHFEKIYKSESHITSAVVQGITDKNDVREEALIASIWPYLELKPEEMAKRNDLGDPIAYYEDNSSNDQVLIKVLLRLSRRLEIKKRFREQARALYSAFRLSVDPSQKLTLLESYYLLNRDRKIGLTWPDEIEQILTTLESQPKNIKDKYEPLLRDVATLIHKSGVVTARMEDLHLAVKAYETYLYLYPHNRYEGDMRLNLAEALFKSGQNIRAAAAYEQAAQVKKSNAKEILGSAIEAYIEGLKQPEKLALVDRAQGEYGFQLLGQAYLKRFPGDGKSRAIEFNMAKALFDKRDFVYARKDLRMFISRHRKTEEADSAALLLMDSFFQENDLKSLAKEGDTLLSSGALSDSAVSQVRDLVKKANLRTLREMAGNFGSKQYSANLIKIANSGKDSSLGEAALYEAFLSAKASHDHQVFSIGETYVVKFGGAVNAKSVHLDLIQMSLAEADYRAAARYLESFAGRNPQDSQANDYLNQAENLYKDLLSVEDLRRVTAHTGHIDKLAALLFTLKQWPELAKVASQVTGLSGTYYQGIALYHSADPSVGLNLLSRASELQQRSPEEEAMLAHALFVVVQEDFLKTRRNLAPQTLSPALIKSAAVEAQRLETELAKVLEKQQGRWVLAALYTMGELQLTVAKLFKESQPPPGLSRPQMDKVLGPQIQKAEARAQQFFDQCWQLAKEKNILSNYVIGCRHPKLTIAESDEFPNPTHYQPADAAKLSAIRSNLATHPDDNPAWMKLVQNLYTQQDYPQARIVLAHALEGNKANSASWVAMGYVQLHLGDPDGSASAFTKALGLDPNSPSAKLAQSKLRRHFTGESLDRAPAASPTTVPWHHPWLD